jgi:hypothetical protein
MTTATNAISVVNFCSTNVNETRILAKMKRLPLVLFFILVATVAAKWSTVRCLPTSPQFQQQSNTGMELPRDKQTNGNDAIKNMQTTASVASNKKPAPIERITHSNQVPPAKEAAFTTKRPSTSQTNEREQYSQQRNSSIISSSYSSSAAAPDSSSSLTNPRNTPYRQHQYGVNTHNPKGSTYPVDERLPEGSGAGPLHSAAGKSRKPKLDDTDDSSDDDSDDEDYDYRDSLDSGSGYGGIASTTTRPQPGAPPARGEIVGKPPPAGDFYSPFRPPPPLNAIIDPTSPRQTNSGQPQTTRQVGPSLRPPMNVIAPSSANASLAHTTVAPPSSATTTTTGNGIVIANNRENDTKTEIDYDYEDDTEDDDSEETSVFEDNDSDEPVNKPASHHHQRPPNSTVNAQTNYSRNNKNGAHKTETTIHSVSTTSTTNRPAQHISMTTELPATIAQRYTTARPVTTIKPAITPSVVAHSGHQDRHKIRPNNVGGDDHLNEQDEDEEGEEDEEDEEDIEEDEGIEEDLRDDDDDDDEEPVTGSHQVSPSATIVSQHSTRAPTVASTKPPHIVGAQTKPPNHHNNGSSMQATNPNVSSSQDSQGPSGHHSPTTTTASTTVIKTTIAPSQIVTVPKSTSPATSTGRMEPTNTTIAAATNQLKPVVYDDSSKSSRNPQFAPPPSGPPTSSPALSDTTSLSPKYMITPPMQDNIPSGRTPSTPVTTNILQYDRGLRTDNNDTLTKQIYDKAVEVYQEADKTIRAAWQAVWPPNINFDSSSVDPLLNQPLFFMCEYWTILKFSVRMHDHHHHHF